ncbi:MAG TPA: YigZ family protein [Thermoanaerobaculia bacterium]|nr:YigZ family protein [Thermoanaerobaculia bacterium]
MAAYLAPAGESRAEIREKGSRFLAVVSPAADEAAAKGILESLARRYPDATHHCWAWRLGRQARERSADAGEPAGTAGVPMLQVLRGARLSDVVAVVIRWFGGTKLGKGGLARAYAGAVREAVAGLPVVSRVPVVRLGVEVPYERVGAVKRLIRPPEVELEREEYGATARLELVVHEERLEALRESLAELGAGMILEAGKESNL